MAFTIDNTTYQGTELPWDGTNRHIVMKKTIDFSQTANNLIQTGTMGLFDIPADVLVLEVLVHVLTADTDVTDVDVGTYSTAGVAVAADGFLDGATLAATGWVRDVAGETYSQTDGTVGYVAATAWSIGILNNDADTINGAVVEFVVIALDLR